MRLIAIFLSLSALCLAGCIDSQPNEVIVYAALDREFSEPILKDIGQEMNLRILPRFDVESNKTVGLANAILAEKDRPRCDVFWNNEILHTLRLQNAGILKAWTCPAAERYPADFVSPKKDWYGFAARARVLIINTEKLPDRDQWPSSFMDLAKPKWKDKCVVARPLFGTSATHAAVLFDRLGSEDAEELYRSIASNAGVVGGNKQVAQKVAGGEYLFGLTDTDDAIIEIENAKPVAIVFPDQAESQSGALLIPNTLCVINGGPNTDRAIRLVDRLLAADIEQRLAASDSAQIPVASDVKTRSRVEPENELQIMQVDFPAAAASWDEVAKTLVEIFPAGG